MIVQQRDTLPRVTGCMIRFLAAAALFATAASASDVIALSPAERSAAIEAAAANGDDLPLNGSPRRIHGEVGMAIGSNGYRSLYGTTAIPLGQTGTAVISLATSQFGSRRR